MSAHCHSHEPPAADGAYRRVLWVALLLNAGMFLVEVITGVAAGSSSLLADAVDFAGDAANYALSLGALALAPAWRPRVAFFKGLSMGGYGLLVLGITAWHATQGTVPRAATMGIVATVALAVNVSVAAMLYRYRTGDADMRSVWLCSRNDAIANVAVLVAAAGVLGSASGWPDWLVAVVLAGLALTSCVSVVRHARREILDGSC
ncbi:MAG TPA: cation transporter, partial [Burkholderiales bacterium]|nr:cation transporter [Burkholderiales bacterium]